MTEKKAKIIASINPVMSNVRINVRDAASDNYITQNEKKVKL